jgi:hypothetical protein
LTEAKPAAGGSVSQTAKIPEARLNKTGKKREERLESHPKAIREKELGPGHFLFS